VPDPTDRTANLAITSIVGSVTDANGYNADFTGALNTGLGIVVGSSPLQIASIGVISTPYEYIGGQTVQLQLTMSEGVTVNTSGGSPTLTLNDGATATYDANASNLSAGTLVFDYTVGINDRAAFLAITSVNLNGAVVKDSGGHNADFTLPLTADVGLQIGPARVASVSTLLIGEYSTGQVVHVGINMTDSLVLDTSRGSPTLTLNDGAVATYDSSLSDLDTGSLVFDYTVGANDHTPDLEITSVNPNGAIISDVFGSQVDLSGALNVPTNITINSLLVKLPDNFTGAQTSDIPFRNDATGDTGFYQMSNGANVGWQDIGATSTAYSVVGVGDFTGSGADDFLFRDNATGGTPVSTRWSMAQTPAGTTLVQPPRHTASSASAISPAAAPTTSCSGTTALVTPAFMRWSTASIPAGTI
jgi:hypothetical protein